MTYKNHARLFSRNKNSALSIAALLLVAVTFFCCTDRTGGNTQVTTTANHTASITEEKPVQFPPERFTSDEPLTGKDLWTQILRALGNGHTITEITDNPYLVLDANEFDSFFETDPADSFGRWLPWHSIFQHTIPGRPDSPELPSDPNGSFLITPETDPLNTPWSDTDEYDESTRIVILKDVMRVTTATGEHWFIRIGTDEQSPDTEAHQSAMLFGNSALHHLVSSTTTTKGIPESIVTLITTEQEDSVNDYSGIWWGKPFAQRTAPSVNLRNLWGITPVLLAIRSGNADLVNYLVNNGANLWIRDMLGRTPLDYINLYLNTENAEHRTIRSIIEKTLRFQSAVPPAGFNAGGKPQIIETGYIYSFESTLAPLLRSSTPLLPSRKKNLSGTFPFGYSPGDRPFEKSDPISLVFTKTNAAQLVSITPDGRPAALPHNLLHNFSKMFEPELTEQNTLFWILSGKFEDYDLSDASEIPSNILYLVDAPTGDTAFIHAHNDIMWIASVAPDANRLLVTIGKSRLAAVDIDRKTHILPVSFDGSDWKIQTKVQWLNSDEVLVITPENKLTRYDVSTGKTSVVAENVTGFAAHPWSVNQELIYMEDDAHAHWKSLATNAHTFFPVRAGKLEDVLFDQKALNSYLILSSSSESGQRWSLVHLDKAKGTPQVVEENSEDLLSLLSVHPATGELVYVRRTNDMSGTETSTLLSYNPVTATTRTLAVLPGRLFKVHSRYYNQDNPRILFEFWENTPSDWYEGIVFLWMDMTTGEIGNYSKEQFLRPEGGRACPHLHIHDGSSWQLIGEIIGANNSRFYSEWDTAAVPRHLIQNGQLRIKITEDLFETTYLDSVRLVAGGTHIHARNHPATLREKDKEHLVLEQGDHVELIFDVPTGLEATAVLEFSGYYLSFK